MARNLIEIRIGEPTEEGSLPLEVWRTVSGSKDGKAGTIQQVANCLIPLKIRIEDDEPSASRDESSHDAHDTTNDVG